MVGRVLSVTVICTRCVCGLLLCFQPKIPASSSAYQSMVNLLPAFMHRSVSVVAPECVVHVVDGAAALVVTRENTVMLAEAR